MTVDNILAQLRTVCLPLPEAQEDGGVGDPTFKVRGKIFAMRHPMQNRSSLWCKAPPGLQEGLVDRDPDRFFVPPYVGQHGWVGLWLDVEVDWELVGDLVEKSYRMTAPKRLSKMLDERKASG
jgi:predicted DNA-binding protein (MmcQ/YjbR family)